MCTMSLSHPLRVRGLKPGGSALKGAAKASHPLRVRGLKRLSVVLELPMSRRILYGCVD